MEIKITVKTTKAFDKWFDDLKDYEAVAAIRLRIENIKFGNFGDFKKIQGAKGIYELRLHLKAGYRIYYCAVPNRQRNTLRTACCAV